MNYLYNGVELPDIYTVYTPEVQKELPLAVIFDSTEGGTTYGSTSLWLFKTYEYTESTSYKLAIIATDGCKYCSLEDGLWSEATEYDGLYPTLVFKYLKWSNFDILNKDGSVYLAASEPIPIYPPNPTAMLMGYMVGQAIRK